MKINSITTRETNEYYDPERCHDGGGYSQPAITIEFGDGRELYIADTSCGGFGDRVYARYYVPGMEDALAACNFGSMADDRYSTFMRDIHGEMLALVAEATGYCLPTFEDMAEGDIEEWEE